MNAPTEMIELRYSSFQSTYGFNINEVFDVINAIRKEDLSTMAGLETIVKECLDVVDSIGMPGIADFLREAASDPRNMDLLLAVVRFVMVSAGFPLAANMPAAAMVPVEALQKWLALAMWIFDMWRKSVNL